MPLDGRERAECLSLPSILCGAKNLLRPRSSEMRAFHPDGSEISIVVSKFKLSPTNVIETHNLVGASDPLIYCSCVFGGKVISQKSRQANKNDGVASPDWHPINVECIGHGEFQAFLHSTPKPN